MNLETNQAENNKTKCDLIIQELFGIISDLNKVPLSEKAFIFESLYLDLFQVWRKYNNIVKKHS
jgi:hypothetical protein